MHFAMSKYTRKYNQLVHAYPCLDNKTQRKILKEKLNDHFLNFVGECCLNLFNNNIPLQEKQIKKLVRYKGLITLCKESSVPNPTKIKRLNQKGHGAFLPLLFSIISPFISSAVSNLFK